MLEFYFKYQNTVNQQVIDFVKNAFSFYFTVFKDFRPKIFKKGFVNDKIVSIP